MDRFIQLNLEF